MTIIHITTTVKTREYTFNHFGIGHAVLRFKDIIDLLHDVRFGVKNIESGRTQGAVGSQTD